MAEAPPLYAAARPLVTVVSLNKEEEEPKTIKLPSVFLTPIRLDIVQFVHTNMRKNDRQPYAVSEGAGNLPSARSWGTGRAVSRIPRVRGSGTSRAGQAAFGNMCRGGRMFAPTKIWRKWHRKINVNQKRFAVAAALAATAVTPLVQARGHRIQKVPEIPLVVSDEALSKVDKTKAAVNLLKQLGAYADVDRVKRTRSIRSGKGKWRNRRYVQRKGPLIVYDGRKPMRYAFRNLPGVELIDVSRLNLLQLAPGGHLGRFCIWTESAFTKLDKIYGDFKNPGKKGFVLPSAVLSNADISRVLNADEVQSVLRKKRRQRRAPLKKNPLKNLGVRLKLDPYYIILKRKRLLQRQPENIEKFRKQIKARRKRNKYKGPQTNLEKLIKNTN